MTRREPVWRAIAATLRSEIAMGIYTPGTKLPTEAALAARFGVNRHTVRHALADLAADGLTHARRGAGVFVTAAPRAEYPLGRRVRFERNVTASGRAPSRQVLRIETRPATPTEAEILQDTTVHVYEGLSFGDETPICLFCSVFPAGRLPGLPEALGRLKSVTAALSEMGITDYTRASTRITAKTAHGPRAGLLRIAEGAPILRTEAVNVDSTGRIVELGSSWFAGERVALTIADEVP